MERVLVIGPCGAGKSTAAVELGAVLGLPVHHLDRLHWRAGWVESSREELETALAPILAGERWLIDGKPLSTNTSIGLTAMAAVAGQAAEPELARPFVQQLWDATPPEGQWRYYNGLLYFLGLLQAGGRFQVFEPVQSSK